MLFHFDLYPAELLKAILDAERNGGDALAELKAMLSSLVLNDDKGLVGSIGDVGRKMLDTAQTRSATYRANACKRDYSKTVRRQRRKSENGLPDEAERVGEEVSQNTRKPPNIALDEKGLVQVTEDEKTSLIDKYGADLPKMVEILSAYKESSGKKYKSDAGALRGWVSREMEDRLRKAGAKSFKAQERERDANNVSTLLTPDERRYYGI